MKIVKLLIIIILLSVSAVVRGQSDEALLEKIDFNDTTLVDSDLMKTALADYISSAENKDLSGDNQMYEYILAADNVLQRCTDYRMYKFVYQYLIYGFSELGANMVVDYMRRLPYFEYVEATIAQTEEIQAIAESYNRVKLGAKAPNIEALTVDNADFNLYNIEAKYTIVLFWSYSCPHCRELVGDMGLLFSKNKDIAIVTICVSKDIKKARRLLKKSHLAKGWNICDGNGWNSQIVDDYAVDMTPSLFLLDKNKTIVGKPFDIEEILNSVEL